MAKTEVSNWTKAEVMIQVLVLIIAFFAFYFVWDASNIANKITQTNLNYQNFNVTIVPYVVAADVGKFYYNGTNLLHSYGNMNLSLIVITPHALILNCSNFEKATIFHYSTDTFSGYSILDLRSISGNMIFMGPMWKKPTGEPFIESEFPSVLSPYYQEYLAFVQPGVTQVNFSIPMYVDVWLNRQLLESRGEEPFGFHARLANFDINVAVTDLITNEQFIEGFSGPLETYIYLNVNS